MAKGLLFNAVVNFYPITSGIAAALLIIVAFGAALLALNHVWGLAILFIISMALLCAGLVVFAMETTIGLSQYDDR